MAAQQFSLVMFRIAAVYVAFTGLNIGYSVISMKLMSYGDYRPPTNYVGIIFASVYLLCAALFWTLADRFAGTESSEKITVKAGNWVVRLVFSCLGIFLMLYSLNAISTTIMQLTMPEYFRTEKPLIYADVVVDGLKFLIGVYIFLTYRFDKAAAFEAAQAIQSTSTEE